MNPRLVKLERLSLDEWMRVESERAAKCFAAHEIVRRDDRSWRCRSPKGSEFWFEVFVSGPIVSVVGDFDPCAFAYYSGVTPHRAVAWIGAHPLDWYVLQKASIGTGSEAVRAFDRRVWTDDALECVAWEISDDNEPPPIDTSTPMDLDNLRSRGATEAILDALEQDLDAPPDLEIEGASRWGTVPADRVVLAHAALRRLHELLSAEESAKEAQP